MDLSIPSDDTSNEDDSNDTSSKPGPSTEVDPSTVEFEFKKIGRNFASKVQIEIIYILLREKY